MRQLEAACPQECETVLQKQREEEWRWWVQSGLVAHLVEGQSQLATMASLCAFALASVYGNRTESLIDEQCFFKTWCSAVPGSMSAYTQIIRPGL